MRERPILFSAPMVRAILDGRKTQTRRVIKLPKVPPSRGEWEASRIGEGARLVSGEPYPDQGCIWHTGTGRTDCCPYGAPGDRLWVRENFTIVPASAYRMSDGVQQTVNPNDRYMAAIYAAGWDRSIPKWKPSIHMPRWASRITLEITDVRVERLQNISEADAIAEGIAPLFSGEEVAGRPDCALDPMPWRNYLWHGHVGRSILAAQSDAWPHQFSSYDTAVGSYSSLWASINGAESWDANPWVWAVSFKRVEAHAVAA